jgi:hypothetical protein
VVFIVGIISAIAMMIYDRRATKKVESTLEGQQPASDK